MQPRNQLLQPLKTLRLPPSLITSNPQVIIPFANNYLLVLCTSGKFGIIDLKDKHPTITMHTMTWPYGYDQFRTLQNWTEIKNAQGEVTGFGLLFEHNQQQLNFLTVLDLKHPRFPSYKHFCFDRSSGQKNFNRGLISLDSHVVGIGNRFMTALELKKSSDPYILVHDEKDKPIDIAAVKDYPNHFITIQPKGFLYVWKLDQHKPIIVNKIWISQEGTIDKVLVINKNQIILSTREKLGSLLIACDLITGIATCIARLKDATVAFEKLPDAKHFIRYTKIGEDKIAEVWNIQKKYYSYKIHYFPELLIHSSSDVAVCAERMGEDNTIVSVQLFDQKQLIDNALKILPKSKEPQLKAASSNNKHKFFNEVVKVEQDDVALPFGVSWPNPDRGIDGVKSLFPIWLCS